MNYTEILHHNKNTINWELKVNLQGEGETKITFFSKKTNHMI